MVQICRHCFMFIKKPQDFICPIAAYSLFETLLLYNIFFGGFTYEFYKLNIFLVDTQDMECYRLLRNLVCSF